MKIGIITLDDYGNYGNRLQNYALSLLMKSLNCNQVYTLIIESARDRRETIIRKISISSMGILMRKIYCFLLKKNNVIYKRDMYFRKFTNKYIEQRLMCIDVENTSINRKKIPFDYFIVGSDQVWNPSFAGEPQHFLTFAPTEKRLACMASIGVTELPDEVIPNYKKWLSEMKYISVREKSAAELIEDMTGRKVDVFFDPTLLLERQRWLDLCKRPKTKLPERYLVSFFLGERPEAAIVKYVKEYDLPVVYLNCKDFPEYYVLGPAEFLYVLLHSELVLTDSFHGTALSMKLWKQFYVFKRKEQGMDNMFTRIETILEAFHLEERFRECCCENEDEDGTEVISIEKFEWIESETQKEAGRFKETMRKYITI